MSKLSLVWLGLVVMFLSACGVNSNIMLKQPKGVEMNSDEIPLNPKEDYRIAVNDKIVFQMFSNDGSELLENEKAPSRSNGLDNNIEYTVQRDGMVELPKIGRVQVGGLTIQACEDTLEALFAQEYIDPFVRVKVTNQRVIVFPGNGSDAQVVILTNANTTLMEAIALAGGITDRGKANTVKLMRMENGERKVYVMDLSVIEGLKFTDLVVQANDYIYIEPTPELSKEFAEKVIPITSLLTTFIVLLTYLSTL